MMKRIQAALWLFALLLVCAPRLGAQDSRLVEGRLIEAVAAYDAGSYQQARRALLTLSSLAPDNDAVFYYLGLCDAELGDLEEAETFLRKAVELDPHNYWYKDRLAALYSATGKPELTIGIYESLLEDYPKRTELYYGLVNLYARQNQPEKVLETLDTIELLSGRNEMVALTKYDLLLSQNKPEEAFRVLEDYNREFTSSRVLSAMGDFKLAEYEDSLALAYYEEALEYDPSAAQALLGKAEIMRMRRSYPAFFATVNEIVSSPDLPPQPKVQYLTSILQHGDPRMLQSWHFQVDSLVDRCVATHPSDSTVLQFAGSYYYTNGDNDKARANLLRYKETSPDSYGAHAIWVQFLASVEDWDALLTDSEEAFRRFPDELAFLDMKSVAYYNKGDFERLVQENERIIRLAPKDTSVTLRAWANIGDAYHMMGQTRKAYQAYEKALKINPRYAPVLNNYAYYLSEEGRKLRKALAMSRITIEKEPDNPTYLDTLGWILYLLGRSEEAKPYFKHAMLYGGKDSATILSHYAEVLYSLGENDVAKVYENLAAGKDKE